MHSKMTTSFALEGFRFHTPHLNSFHFLLKIFWINKEIQYSCATSAKISFNKFGSNKILPQTWTSNWNLKLRSGLTLYFSSLLQSFAHSSILTQTSESLGFVFLWVSELFLLAQRRMQPSFCIFFVFASPETEHTHMWESICWQIFISSC